VLTFVKIIKVYRASAWQASCHSLEDISSSSDFIQNIVSRYLAYVLGRRKDEVFLKLKALLEPFGITRYYTDYWGAYTRHLDADEHQPGKRNTQQIERKHLTLRTRIKRLVRKTICFSRSTQMHDIVIGLFVNRYEFGLPV
jgi:insertion element IS1 protein InsB